MSTAQHGILSEPNTAAARNTAQLLHERLPHDTSYWPLSLPLLNLLQAWRVYQRGLERWLADLLQPVFDNLISDKAVPRFVQRLRILEFTLDHEAPYFDNMRRRSSRKDSDLNGVVDVRYTGGARMLLQLEVGQGRWRLKVSGMHLLCGKDSKLAAGGSGRGGGGVIQRVSPNGGLH